MTEFSGLIDNVVEMPRQQALSSAVTSIEDDPEQASRAIKLGDASGIDPSAVYADVENFDRQVKGTLTGHIVRNNQHLQDYINSHPLASKVSNDDWGQLDKLSEHLTKVKQVETEPHPVWGAIPDIIDSFKEFASGLAEAPGQISGTAQPSEQEKIESQNVIDYLTRQGWDPKAAKVEADFLEKRMQRGRGLQALIFGPGIATSIGGAVGLGAFIAGQGIFRANVARPIEEATGFPKESTEQAAMVLLGAAGIKGMKDAQDRANITAHLKEVHDAVAPYVEAGESPPMGVHPTVDKLIIDQSKVDLDNLDQAMKEAQSSTTRERSPELFSNFIKQHTDARIGISADAIRELYKDKEPLPDDNILGWVPNIAEKLREAEATGGMVEIPLSEWLTKSDTSVYQELKDDIRVRPGGVTKNEVKELAEQKKAIDAKAEEEQVQPSIVDQVRTQAALDPLFQEAAPEQLKLKKVELNRQLAGTYGDETSQTFAITDQQGRGVGQLLLSERHEGKDLYVEWVGSAGLNSPLNMSGANAFGPKLIRGLLEQLKEHFPNAEFLSGHRVTGAREKAGTEQTKGMIRMPLREEFSKEDINSLVDLLREGTDSKWYDFGATAKALVPTEKYVENEQKIILGVQKVLDRVVPGATSIAARETRMGDREVKGLYLQYEKAAPLIVWSLKSEDPVGTAKHEAIHYLRNEQFFTKDEWATLKDAAINNDWFEKHQIDQRYPGASFDIRAEEAVAEEFKNWEREPKSDHPVAKIFQKIKELIDKIRAALREALGYDPTWQDLFKKAESGEIGRRESGGPLDERAARAQEQPELPGLTRQEDLDLFAKAKDIGMNAKQYKAYQELIAKRDAEDVEAQLKRALKDEEKRQTKEWKENESRVRDEVAVDIETRPDMAIGSYFRNGILYGEDTHSRPKLDVNSLTKEQRESLPESYYGDRGINPDDVAGLFGYKSGADLVEALSKYEKDRGDLSHAKYKAKVIDAETELRMQKQYGDLDQNILSEARDHVLSTTQMDLLHEETVALGMRAGSEMPFGKADIKSWVESEFAKANAKEVKSSKYLESAGKAGRLAELALLDNEPGEAFKQKQRQYFSALLAREAKKFEKEKASFDRQMKRFTKREVAGVEQEFTNFIHDLMVKAEIPVKRTEADLANEIEKSGYKSFESFVGSKAGDGWELDAPDNILTGDVKPLDQMTVQEFREFRDVTKSLAYIGREVSKIEIAGQKQDFAEWKGKVLDNIRELLPRKNPKDKNMLYAFDAEFTRLEEIVKDLDLRRELGPLYNALIRPMMDGKHKEFQLQEKLVKNLSKLKEGNKEWQRTLQDSIPQDFFIDPDTGLPFDLTREHMINIMLNFGNKSNVEKFTQGWFGKDGAKAAEHQFLDLFSKHASEQDFEYVRKLSDIFKEWKEDSDNMYRNLSGIAPKGLEIEPDGWYFPVIYDKYYSDINAITERKDSNALFGGNYFKATTANGYTKARTGYTDRVEFQNSLEQLPTRMQQTMHDISYRPAVMQASKIIYDKEIKAAIRKHYGQEYEAQLDPWLKAIANHYSFNEKDISQTNAFMRRVRMNLVVNALGLNLKQLGSPDVGVLTVPSMWRAMKFLDGDTKFAMENSKEIPHTLKVMDRDFRESLERTIATTGLEGMQATAARFAFIPMAKISQRFRVATFTQKYQDAISRGLSHADAVEVADSFIRERHGATGVPDMPAIMRGSETRKLITLFYGFGNATYNWQRQIPGAIRQGDWSTAMAAAYGAVLIPSFFGIALYNSRKEDDSWFKTAAKGLALQVGQTVALARDVVNYAIEGQSARSPLASAAQTLQAAASDAYKYFNHKEVNKPIQHAANVVGIALGLPGAQIGRTTQFLADVKSGKQRPKNFLEYLRGIIHGEAKLRK